MKDGRDLGSKLEDPKRPSRRSVLRTAATLGLTATVGTAAGNAQDNSIEYGDTVSGTTDERWTFMAEEGDEVTVEVRPDDPVDNSADIDLLDPSDEVVEDVGSTGEDGNAVITLYEIERNQGGEYTIVASGDGSFGYELSLYEGVPVDATVEYGETVESEFTRDNRYYNAPAFGGYHETYSFAAAEGDEISVEVRPDDPVDNAAQIALLDPSGEIVEDVEATGEDGNSVITGYDVGSGQGGEYTIVASGDEMTDLFEYELRLVLENRAEQTESPTPTETATQTQSPTPTRTATQTESPTPTERETPTQTDTPTDTEETSGSGPGFGVGSAILGLGGVGYALKRTAISEDDES
jgi:hypothetical protein